MARGTGAATAGLRAPSRWRVYEPLELTPILAAALEAFYEHGFHGTTVRDIARRVGQTVPSLYYHHENKEGIFVALLEMGTTEVAWRVKAALAEAGDDPQAQLVNVVQAIVLHMTHHTRLASLDLELRHLSPPMRKRYAARRKEVENLVTTLVEDGVRRGVFTTPIPEEAARALLGMCQSVARWYNPAGPLTPQQIADRYVDLALATVGIQKSGKRRQPTGDSRS